MSKTKVVVFGSGRSAFYLIDYLAHSPVVALTVADLSAQSLKDLSDEYPQIQTKVVNAADVSTRRKLIEKQEVVISLLPPAMHESLAQEAVDLGKHFLTASYVTDGMEAIGKKAADKGLVVLMECGLDPGIDHLSAMEIIDQLKEKGAKIRSFKSYTGGLVAPESDDNPWHYKISWNPMNVVKAGQGIARYFKDGGRKLLPYQRLFKETDTFQLPEIGAFEGYYNRDSQKYRDIYSLDGVDTLIRGTLRRPGFCEAWDALVQLGLTDDSYQIKLDAGMTYDDFTRMFLKKDADNAKALEVALGTTLFEKSWEKLSFLGLFSQEKIGLLKASPAEVMNQLLLEKWKMQPQDKDWVVMLHEFIYDLEGNTHHLRSAMNLKGDDHKHTAMAKTVGWPLGIFTELLAKGAVRSKGLTLPTSKEIYQPILAKLKELGIVFKEELKS